MKTLIRWLADVAGVTQQIRDERAKEIANSLIDASFYMTGGFTAFPKGKSPESGDTLELIGGEMLKPDYGQFNIERIRNEVYRRIMERSLNRAA